MQCGGGPSSDQTLRVCYVFRRDLSHGTSRPQQGASRPHEGPLDELALSVA